MTPHIEREIRTQGAAWRSAIQVLRDRSDDLSPVLDRARGREARFLGSGSSYYLGVAATPAWGRRGWSARALPSAEQLLHADAYFTADAPLAVAVSRSGATTETLRAIEILKRAGSPVVGVTTRLGTPMDEICDVVVHVTDADERSTVQTRSFSSQFLVVQALASLAAEGEEALAAYDSVPDLAETWIGEADAFMSTLADRFERVYVLGTGARWGLAMEGALKLKETSLTESEAFQTLEFRHGPKSMIDSETLVLGLVGAGTRDAELPVLREMRALGATVVAIGAGVGGEDKLSPLSFPASLPADVGDVMFLPPMQLLAYRRGVAKGLDPDHPRHLSFAVELEGI